MGAVGSELDNRGLVLQPGDHDQHQIVPVLKALIEDGDPVPDIGFVKSIITSNLL